MTGTRNSLLDMETIGRSLQNCSLSTANGGATRLSHHRSTVSETGDSHHRSAVSETGDSEGDLELNSNVRLPHSWEQCLDLNTGEVYYINWNTGVKSMEDPRTMLSSSFHDARLAEQSILQEQGYVGGEESSYSDEDDDEEDDEEDDEPSSPSSSSSTTTNSRAPAVNYYSENESSASSSRNSNNGGGGGGGGGGGDVLVVAGCKACFMYLMVPKQDEECPKCYGKLIHFDPNT